MNEEEEHAIWYFSEVWDEEDKKQWKVIENLIDKQQKEIEGLKKPKDNIQVVYAGRSNGKTLKAKEFITKEYISKDKIRDKIKEIEEEHAPEDDYAASQIYILEKLLEEE